MAVVVAMATVKAVVVVVVAGLWQWPDGLQFQ